MQSHLGFVEGPSLPVRLSAAAGILFQSECSLAGVAVPETQSTRCGALQNTCIL
jgi:hypothetical protein